MNFAIVGAGYIGEVHARAVINHPEAHLAAVVDIDPQRAAGFAERFSIPAWHLTLQDMLQSQSIDAVVIGTPNYLHAGQAELALQAGCHVLVEKPAAISVQEAEKMEALSRETGRTLMIAHCWRYDHEVLWLKDQLKANRIGPITRTKSYAIHENWGPQGWFVQKALAGGGALMDMGIHAIDTTRFLLDDPLPTSLFALLKTNYGNFDVDDTGMLLIEWDNGITSFIETGWWQPYKDGPEAATQIFGASGFGSVFPTCLHLIDKPGQKPTSPAIRLDYQRTDHAEQAMYDRQMEHFIHCIQNKSTPSSNGAQGIINMKILEAAYQSSQSHEVVHFHF